LVAGYWLYRAGKISNRKIITVIIFFIGIAFCSIINSIGFAGKMAQ